MTPYDDIYEAFKRKVEDISLSQMKPALQNEMLKGWLDDAIGYIELDGLKIKNDLSDRDDLMECFNSTLYNSEIVVLSLYMIVAWYESKINSLENTLNFWGSKDEKWGNQKDHWNATVKRQNEYRKRARKYFNHYAYKNNDYLRGEVGES